MRPSFSLAELLPHRPPMVLLDELVDWNEETGVLTSAFIARPEWTGNWVAIEYMAQAAAALVGLHDRLDRSSAPARPGFLLGTRRLDLALDAFQVGARYCVTAKNVFADDLAAAFECRILSPAGETVASAVLNAFRPPDVAAFLAEQRKETE